MISSHDSNSSHSSHQHSHSSGPIPFRASPLPWLALMGVLFPVFLGFRGASVVEDPPADNLMLFREGRDTFRHDTFGDEDYWGGTLKLHLAVEGQTLGGVGPGLTPRNALRLGLKVDADALPDSLRNALATGQVDLDDPANTLALLRANSVVGITGFFDAPEEHLVSIGIQCALCHSTVDDYLAPGIGSRRDGWANRDLDIGRIVSLAPDLSSIATLLNTSQDTVQESSTPNSCSTARPSDPTGSRPRR
jgi:hypothetical protein